MPPAGVPSAGTVGGAPGGEGCETMLLVEDAPFSEEVPAPASKATGGKKGAAMSVSKGEGNGPKAGMDRGALILSLQNTIGVELTMAVVAPAPDVPLGRDGA